MTAAIVKTPPLRGAAVYTPDGPGRFLHLDEHGCWVVEFDGVSMEFSYSPDEVSK